MFLLHAAALLSLTLSAAPPSGAAALEHEARQIEAMLIAPCCWTQPVSQHQSEASDEVKREIRALLASGESRQEVLHAFVAQYGQRILVEPPATGFGLVLYGGLGVAFLLTGAALVLWVRRVSQRPATGPAALPVAAGPDDAAYAEQLDEELREMD